MVTTIPDKSQYTSGNNYTILASPQAMAYGYDQLNRVSSAESFAVQLTTNSWDTSPNGDNSCTYTYDRNGNLDALSRNSVNGNMDNFQYNYALSNYGMKTNRLDYVHDNVLSTPSDPLDIEQGQSTGNYDYDAIGNLIADSDEGISSMKLTTPICIQIPRITR